jgi:hypothetical protein
MSLEFFIKVVEYYSSLHMKYLKRMLSVCKPMINYLLSISGKIEKSLRPNLHNLVEGVFNIQLSLIKLVIEKVVQLLNLKKLSNNLEFDRFRNYIHLFEIWEHFFGSEIADLIKYTIPADCTFKDRVYVLKSKMNGHLITTNKSELILNFVNALHKNVMTVELKKEMDDDTWQAVDIPTNFYEPIGYLITGDTWSSILLFICRSSKCTDNSIRKQHFL